ncbi:MAG: peptidoglycan DD-metalloendopeptidase family protein [Aggregatilineales bacterium]
MSHKNNIITLLLCILLGVAACQSGAPETTAEIVNSAPPTQAAIVATAVPTAGPLFPTRTPSPSPTITNTPSITPTETNTSTITPTETDTLTPTLSPTPTVSPTPERMVDTFYFNRPIASGGTDRLDRTYPYGSTQNGRRQVHHGVEFQNPRGTPVLAVAGGTVFYAGDDSTTLFGPVNDYYGNLVVIEHGVRSVEGSTVYTLYAHLDAIEVETGQEITAGDRVGRVGATGIAEGAHLHFEVRVGDPNDFDATNNPDLWFYPQFDEGIIAGYVVDARGNPVFDEDIQFRRVGSNTITYETYTYADTNVNPNESWGENFARGDLREGDYEVIISTDSGTVLFRGEVTVEANHTSFIDIQLSR